METETIYVDSLNHCHRIDSGTMTAVQTGFFTGKCSVYIEGFCYEIRENGCHIYPWKPLNELEAAQAQYEADLAEAAAAYREGVNSAYDN